jgi:hypothetical protein
MGVTMKKATFQGIFSLVLWGLIFLASNQLSGAKSFPLHDTTSFFLYIDYCGTRYNQGIQRAESYIKVVILPACLLKKIPRLKNYGQYSQKNRNIYFKQQDIIRPYRGDNMTIRIDQNKFKDFYPEGLKKGFIIEESEFNRWDFIEKPHEHYDPVFIKENNQLDLYWDDLINNAYIVVDHT